MMPILMTRPVTPASTTPPAAAPLRTQPYHSPWLDPLRQRFRQPVPHPLQVPDAHLAQRARRLVQRELALASMFQGVIADVDQGVVTLYGSVDTTWRKERLEALTAWGEARRQPPAR